MTARWSPPLDTLLQFAVAFSSFLMVVMVGARGQRAPARPSLAPRESEPPRKQVAQQQAPPAAQKGKQKTKKKAEDDGLPDETTLAALIKDHGVAEVVRRLTQAKGWTVQQAADWIRQKRSGG